MTLSQDTFFLTSIIDAIEQHDKDTNGIEESYLNAKMIDKVLIKIAGKEVDFFY